jgi:ribonucleoside-diphosphate reductase beta chain
MIGMTTIVDWSIRDENKHVEGMTHLFREIVKENKKLFSKELKESIYSICQEITDLEIEFINLIFDRANDNIEGINREEVKNYIKYIADLRLRQLGLRKLYNTENPFEWMNELTSAPEHTNFFERRPTAYTKGGIIWDINNCEFRDE